LDPINRSLTFEAAYFFLFAAWVNADPAMLFITLLLFGSAKTLASFDATVDEVFSLRCGVFVTVLTILSNNNQFFITRRSGLFTLGVPEIPLLVRAIIAKPNTNSSISSVNTDNVRAISAFVIPSARSAV
jgi:hypothetical protein